VTGGAIQIGGVNVKDISKDMLMDTVSYVFQDSRLLKTSILENVRLSRPNASRQEVERVLHEAQCDDIIAKLPQGIDTMIGTKGVYLSGGEQQRISIARALLKDSPIILLDEATASLDAENETEIQQAISQLVERKTVLIIAHRMRTVENANKRQ
jgi:ATP-binding cassette subfamily B protein